MSCGRSGAGMARSRSHDWKRRMALRAQRTPRSRPSVGRRITRASRAPRAASLARSACEEQLRLPHACCTPIRQHHGLSYETLDVFTNKPCGGNPLAVVYGAECASPTHRCRKSLASSTTRKPRLCCRPRTRARPRASEYLRPRRSFRLLAIQPSARRARSPGAARFSAATWAMSSSSRSRADSCRSDETATGGSSRRRCLSNSATSARASARPTARCASASTSPTSSAARRAAWFRSAARRRTRSSS